MKTITDLQAIKKLTSVGFTEDQAKAILDSSRETILESRESNLKILTYDIQRSINSHINELVRHIDKAQREMTAKVPESKYEIFTKIYETSPYMPPWILIPLIIIGSVVIGVIIKKLAQ